MNNFITNQKDIRGKDTKDSKTLKGRIKQIIKGTGELKFLVGFFYFSGLQELYESIKDNKYNINIKILVGLQVDILLNRVNEISDSFDDENSDEEKIDLFFKSLEKAINNDEQDIEEFYTQVEFFIKLIEENRLTIRKTEDPNHAKLYIFKLAGLFKDVSGDGNFITGSSNLTRSGLVSQNEFNVEIKDYGLDTAEEYFDELWDSAIEITEDDVNRRKLLDFMKNGSQTAFVTPFEAYALVLKSYLELHKQKELKPVIIKLLEDNNYKKYSYQLDAVKQALTIIDEYNGVIIADVVGLGKSVIASLIAKSLGKRGLILSPPGLMGNQDNNSGWHGYLNHFKLNDWHIESTGKLDSAIKFLSNNSDIEVVIIDEAHRFRNEDTSSYELLSAITKNKKVILLTATPFNNNPSDIFSLLKLFIIPGKSPITLDENLEYKFKRYKALFNKLLYIFKHYNPSTPITDKKRKKRMRALRYYNDLILDGPIDISLVQKRSKGLGNEIKTIIAPIIIRRNRIDLKSDYQYKREVTNLSNVRDPQEIFYELTDEQFDFYDQIINSYFKEEDGLFVGAIYQPFLYEKKRDTKKEEENKSSVYWQQKNLFDFMRRLLIKRFESSFGAFYKTIDNFINTHKIVLNFIEKSGKYILDRKLIEKIYGSTSEEIEVELLNFAQKLKENEIEGNNKIYDIDTFELKDEFLIDITNDITLFELIKEKIDSLDLKNSDPKREAVLAELNNILIDKLSNEPERKVIVFTEFTDTLDHIKEGLKSKEKVLFMEKNLNKKFLNNLYSNFDASYKKEKKDKYNTLITTDKLSEGFNLNRAGAVINYDIPWNPTRVIQRLGRINRIGEKVFDELIIRNIFPTKEGNDVIKSKEIAAQKMFLIHNTLGEDSKIFSPDETPTASELYDRINSNPENLEEESFITTIRNRFEDIKKDYPEVIEKINKLPFRVKTAKKYSKDELIVVRKKALSLFTQTVIKVQKKEKSINKVIELPMDSLLQSIECDYNENKLKLSKNFWIDYKKIKEYKPTIRKGSNTKEISIEQKALNNLKFSLRNFNQELEDNNLLLFVKTLIKDINKYHILPKYSLRRIQENDLSKENKIDDFINEITYIKNRFGSNYLDLILKNIKGQKKEVIIAIENQK